MLLAILFVALLSTASHQQQATEFQFNLLPNNNIGGINSMGDGLDATLSTLQTPACIGRDPNSTLLLICDGRNIVRKVTKDNLLITHLYNMDESITFFSPQAIAFDGQGGFFFTAGSMVYLAYPDATIRIYAGSYSTGQLDSTLSSSLFGNVVGLVKRQSTGLLYVADSTNHAIRLLNSTHVTTIGGSLGVSGYTSGSTAASSLLNSPTRLALSLDQNTLLFTDSGNNVVRSIDLTNMHIQTIAGNSSMGYSGDGGLAINARLNSPNGIIVSILGGFYISDTGNNLIRRVFSNGTIITICGASSNMTVETTNPLSVRLNSPTDLFTQTLAGGGETLYIADSGNNRIRKIDFTGVNDLGKIQTVAGSGDIQYYGDTPGLDGSQVSLSNPKFLHVSPVTGNLLITDTDRLRVFSENRKLISSIPLTDNCFSASWFHRNSSDPGDIFYSVPYGVYQRTSTGATKLIAGSTSNYGFEKGPATATRFNNPSSVFVDGNDMYITDTNNHRIRYLDMTSGIIQTIAGTGIAGYSGDGGPASSAKLNYPSSIFVAKYDIYFTERGNNCVRKISRSTSNIDIVAGTPQQKFAGDDNFATRAVFNNPFGIAVVLAGTNKFDAYIADSDNHRIRKIGYDGNITTVAGTGVAGFNGDGIEGTKASLYNPSGLAVSGNNLYICDTNNHLVRLLDLSSGKIGIIAGTPGKSGYAGDNGPATSAYLNYPSALAISGNYLYIADTMNYIVRRVDLSSGNIITFAGTPGQSGSSGDGKQATSANLNRPIHLAIGSAYLYIATSGDDGATVRTVALLGTIIGSLNIPFKRIGAIAFNGVDLCIFDPGNVMIYKYGFSTALIGGSAGNSIASIVSPLTNAILYNVTAMTFASNGALWFADNVLGIIRKTDPSLLNYVYNVAGGVGDGLKPTEAILSFPEGLFHDGTYLYIADSGNHRVRRVGSSSITTIAGSGVKGVDNDSLTSPLLARLNYPVSIAATSGGVVYITDKGNNRIRKLSGSSITTVAGTGEAKFSYDITDPTKATLNQPHQIFLSPTEDLLYLAESAGHNLKVISFGKNIIENVLIDKDCPGGYNEVTDPKSTCLNSPLGVMVTDNSIYIADTDNNRIRSISSSVLKTIAGGIGDGGLAVNAFISYENYVFTSPYSNSSIYIADTYNNMIRQVSLTTGIISTIAGDYWIPYNWDSPFNGDNLLATKTNLNSPKAIAFAPNGDIYISDSTNLRVRKIFASNQTVITLANNLLSPRQLDFYQGNGSLLISDITTVKQIRLDGSLQTVFDTSSTTGLSASLSSKIVYFTDLGLVKSFTLSCPSGYAESKKKTNCLPTCYGIISENTTVCSGNGTCMSPNNCTCNSGYYGNNCELISCYSKLSNNATVCSGNGICVSKDNCKCSSNYFGSECQYTTCNNTLSTLKTVCSSNGKCVAYNNCTCNEGYYGSNCENFYCYGVSNTLPSVCSGRGSCSSYNNCNCQSGYFGNLCEKYTCNGIEKNDTQVCSAHGICSSYNNCTCENGYYDSACASFDCNGVTSQLSACENNGTCSKPGACACVYGYDGDRCEFTRCYGVSASSSKICTGHGKCLSPDNCQCNLGWDGVACNITQCYGLYSYDPTVCSGHGTCAGRDFCDCNKGYSGKYCHLKLCFGKEENDTSVCTGRGQCISPDTCQCESGYNGNECQHHEVFMDPYTVSIYSNHYRLMSQLEKDLLSCEEILTNTDLQYIGSVESRKCQWRKKTGIKIYLGYNHTIKHESVLSILGKLTIQLNATVSDSIRAQAIGATFTKPLDRYPLGHDLVVRTNVNYLYHNFKEIKQSWSCIGCPSQIQTILDANIGKPFLIIPASNLSLITTTSGTLRTLRLVTNSLNSLSTSVTNEYKYSFNPIAKTMPVNFDIWNEVTLGTDMFECVGHTCIIESSITGLNTSLSFTLNDFFIVLNKDFQDKQMFRLTNKLGVRVLESDYSGTCTVFGLHLITYSSSYYPIDISYTTFDNLDFYLTNVNRTYSKNSDISISVVSSDPFVTDFTPSDVFTLYWSCYKLPGMIYIPECDKTGEFSLDLKSGVLSVGSYMIGLMVVTTKSNSFNFNGTIEITDTPLGSPRIEVDQLPSVYPYGDNLVLSSIVYSNSELTEVSWSLLEGDLNIDISNISSVIDSSTTINSLDGYNVQVSLSIDPTYLIEGERYTFQLVSSNTNGRSSANISTQLDRSPRFSCDIYDPLGENYAYSSKFVVYCVNNLESISSYWIDVSDDSGNRIMLLSNTMKRKFFTRLPYHNSGYLNIGIKLINRYGSFSRISRRVKVNSSLSSLALSDRVKYLTSQYRVLSSSEVTRIDTSISIGCLLSFYNMDEDLSSMDLSIKSSFVSTLVNMISSLKKIQDVSLNVDDKIIQLSLPVVHK